MSIHIADAHVDIHARDHTEEDARQIMQRLRDLGPVGIEMQLDDQTRAEIDQISARLEALGPYEIELMLGDLGPQLTELEARLQSLGPVDVGLQLDDRTGADLAAFQARMAALGSYDVSLGLDVDDAAIDALRARLETLGPFSVRIELELDPWAIDNIRRRLAALGGVSVPINTHFDGHAGLAASWAEFERFRLLAGRLLNIPVTAHDNLNVGLGQAYAEMLMFRQLAEHTLRIPVSTSGGINFPGLGGAAGQVGEQAAGRAQMIAAAVVAAFPAISVAVGGAATVAVGAALSAIPVLAWKGSEKVKDAYSDLWKDLQYGIRGITPEWEGLILKMTGTLRAAGAEWSPFFKDIFADLGPGMDSFLTKTISGLDILRPSIRQIVDGFTAMAPALGDQLPKVLDGIVGGFANLAEGVQDHPELFGQLLIDLSEVVRGIGELGRVSMGLFPILDPLYGRVGDLVQVFEDFDHAVAKGVQINGDWAMSFGPIKTAVEESSTVLKQLGMDWGSVGQTVMAVIGGWATIGIDTFSKYNDYMKTGGDGVVLFGDSMKAFAESAVSAAAADTSFGSSQEAVSSIMEAAARTADDLKDALDRLSGKTLDESAAQIAFGTAVRKANVHLDKGAHTLDVFTEAGEKNQKALNNVVKTTEDLVVKMKDNKRSFTDMADTVDKGRKAYIRLAMDAGQSRKEAEKGAKAFDLIAESFRNMPGAKTAKIKGDITDLTAKLNKAKADLKTVPASKRAKLLGDIADLQRKIRAAQAQLAGIQDKTVHVRVMTDHVGGLGTVPSGVKQAYGSIRTFAQGAENHIAQIARPGEYRLWAEDETGGEAYIPLAASKRGRSLAILEDVARRFGVGLTRPFDEGGLEAFAAGGTTPGLTDGGKPSLTELGETGAQMKAEEKAVRAAEKAAAKAAADLKKLLAEIGSAGKKLLDGITKAMLGSLDKVNAYAENLNEMIKKYLSGSKETAALKWAAGIEAKMRAAATSAEALAATIKEAKEFAATTKQTLVGGASIGALGAIGNAQDIAQGKRFEASEMQRFAAQIGDLAKLGLDKDVLMEIIGYGPQQGGAVAAMLLKDTSTLAAINSAQGSIEAAAAAIGNQAADAMYDTGAHAADGFLTGLYAKQKDLEALMGGLGEQLAAGIKKVIDEAKAIAKTPKPKLTEEVKTSKKPSITENVQTKTVKKRASGGFLEAHDWALVGEEGPEVIQTGARSHVYTAGQTAHMMGSTTNNQNITINISGTFDFMDLGVRQRVVQQLGEAIREELRQLDRAKH